MPHAASPPLHANHRIALIQHTQLDGVLDAPLEAVVDVFLPRLRLEVHRLLHGEKEGVDAAVEVRVAGCTCVARHHDDRANGAVFAYETGGVAAVVSCQLGGDGSQLGVSGGGNSRSSEDENGTRVLLERC